MFHGSAIMSICRGSCRGSLPPRVSSWRRSLFLILVFGDFSGRGEDDVFSSAEVPEMDDPPSSTEPVIPEIQNDFPLAFPSLGIPTEKHGLVELSAEEAALAYDAHFEANKMWAKQRWLGVHAEQTPIDAWIIQEILYDTKPDLVVETGTHNGGGALFYASMLSLVDDGTGEKGESCGAASGGPLRRRTSAPSAEFNSTKNHANGPTPDYPGDPDPVRAPGEFCIQTLSEETPCWCVVWVLFGRVGWRCRREYDLVAN